MPDPSCFPYPLYHVSAADRDLSGHIFGLELEFLTNTKASFNRTYRYIIKGEIIQVIVTGPGHEKQPAASGGR